MIDVIYYVLYCAVGFGASVIGSICGIGGGVLIKPILDAFGVLSVSSISFLSSCTVLSMSFYSILNGQISKESVIDTGIGTPLVIGSAVGGIIGKTLF